MKLSSLITLLFLICGIPVVRAGEGRATKEKKQSEHYNVKPGDRLEIDNTYGLIHVNTWDKNEVTVDITISSHAPTESKAEDEMDRVSIRNDSDPVAGKIKFRTMISSRANSWNNSSLHIDYVISAPKKMLMDLIDKYGDIYLDDLEGALKLDLAYGGLSTKSITGPSAFMHIEYSNGNVGTVKKGNLDVSYSNLSIDRADDLTIRNVYGKLDIGTVQKLAIDQKSGNLAIDEAGAVTGIISYTSFRIDKLTKSVALDLKYCGRSDIGSLAPSVDYVGIDAAYSTVTLKPESGCNFTIDAKASYGDIINHTQLKQLGLEFQEKSAQTTIYTGKMGNGSGHIHLNTKYGNITFK